MKIHDNEVSFELAYTEARTTALDPRNWIREDRGESLMGVPLTLEEQRGLAEPGRGVTPARDENGDILWKMPPPSGWYPNPDDPAAPWLPAPLLASVLSTVIAVPAADGIVRRALRVTPEIRVVNAPDGIRPARFLSIELTLSEPIEVTSAIARGFRDAAEDMVAPWFPLRTELAFEWRATAVQRDLPTTVLLRWRDEHVIPTPLLEQLRSGDWPPTAWQDTRNA